MKKLALIPAVLAFMAAVNVGSASAADNNQYNQMPPANHQTQSQQVNKQQPAQQAVQNQNQQFNQQAPGQQVAEQARVQNNSQNSQYNQGKNAQYNNSDKKEVKQADKKDPNCNNKLNTRRTFMQ